MARVHGPDIDEPVDGDQPGRDGQQQNPLARGEGLGELVPLPEGGNQAEREDARPDDAMRQDLQGRHGCEKLEVERHGQAPHEERRQSIEDAAARTTRLGNVLFRSYHDIRPRIPDPDAERPDAPVS